MAHKRYRFGPFLLEGEPWRLTRDGNLVHAPTLSLEILAALVERPGSLWRRVELRGRAGPGRYLGEDALFLAVSKLRVTLEDSQVAPRWIETVPGQGYRFIGALTRDDEADDAPLFPVVAGPVIRVEGVAAPLIGRDALLEPLLTALANGPGIWTLSGPPGVGKTRIAQELLQWTSLPSRLADLRWATTAPAIRLAVGRALCAGATSAEHLGEALRTLGPALIILDNAELGPLAGELTRWAAAAPEARFLVTHRTSVGVSGEQVVSVPPLDLPPRGATLDDLRAHGASRLLLEIAGTSSAYTAVLEDAPAIVDLLALFAGVPLAIELAAPRLRALRPAQLLARAAPYLSQLGATAAVRGPNGAARTGIATIWDMLGQHHRRALAKLAQLPGPFPVELADALLDNRGAVLLADLVEHRVIRLREGGGIEILPVIRAYVNERVAPVDAVVDVAVAWYARAGLCGEGDLAVRYARDEAPNLELALERALTTRAAPAAARILRNLAPTLLVDGPAEELTRWITRVRAAGAVPPADDAWLVLLDAEAAMNREDGRRIGAALDLLRPTDPAMEVRRATLRLALEHHAGAPAGAAAMLESSRRLPGLVEVGRARWAAVAARVLLHAGRLDEAEALLAETIPLAAGPGWRSLQAALWAERGSVALEAGNAARARAAFDEVGRIDAVAPWAEARVLERRGGAALRAGRLDEADPLLEQARVLHQRTGDQRGELVCVEQLGRVAQMRGDAERGAARLRDAVGLAAHLGLRAVEATARGNLGQLLGGLGRLDEAEAELLAALELQTQLGLKSPLTLHNLGAVAAEKGDLALARTRFEAALQGQRAAQNRRGIAITKAALGDLEQRAGRYAAAIPALVEAYGVLRDVGDRMSTVQVGQRLGTAYALAGDLSRANATFAATLEECRTVGLKDQTAATLVRVARAALAHGDPARAKAAWAEADAIAGALRPAPASLTEDLAALARELPGGR